MNSAATHNRLAELRLVAFDIDGVFTDGRFYLSDDGVETKAFKQTTYRPKTLKRGRYRWRVRATVGTSKGEWSGWNRLYMY